MTTTPAASKHVRVYTDQERAVIEPFKEDYYNAKTPKERKILAQLYILPDLFNYWDSLGLDISEEEKKIRSEVSLRFI